MLSEEMSERGSVGLEGIAHELDARERPLTGLVVAGTAGVGDDDGDVTEVGAVSDGRLDADLHRYAADRERGDATVAERDVVWVPSNAEKVILSKIASLERGANSGRSSKPGVSHTVCVLEGHHCSTS